MTYYYLNDKDEIVSTGSLYIARKGTINHMFKHPTHNYGYITTSPQILLTIRNGFKKAGRNSRGISYEAYSVYDGVVGNQPSKVDKSIIEIIYDNGESFFTSKRGKYSPKTKRSWHKFYLSMDGKIGKECFDYLDM